MPNDHQFQPLLLLKFISFQIFIAFNFIYWEIHLWKERRRISSKILVLWLPWDYSFTTEGKFWVLTSWRRYRGTRVQIFLGKNENIIQEDIIYVGKKRFLHYEQLYIFLGDSTFISRRFPEKDLISSRRTHTRGNPSSKILYGMENPKRLIKRRPGKERLNTS